MANLSAIKLPNGTTYNLKDNGALQLTGGQVTGPVTFGDSVSIDDLTVGQLVVEGSASVTNNLQANTINGVTVGSSPKFTDTITTVSTTGSGNAITAISASNGALTATKGTTFLTTHNTYTISTTGSGNAVTAVSLSGTTFTVTKGATYSNNAGTITSVKTTAGTHSTINVTSGAANFNVPTNTSHLTNDSGFLTNSTLYEANLNWGGKDFSGGYSPIDAAMIDVLGANRFAFLKAAGLTIEYSTNGGSSYTDYGATDAQKVGLFSSGQSFYLGKHTSNGSCTTNDRLRVTIDTGAASIYTVLNKIAIYMSTSGATVQVLIEKALQSTPTTYTTHKDWTGITGWSGWNILNISGLTTYGNTASSQYGRIRFTFRQTAVNTNYTSANISKIMGFGGVGWTVPSTMAATGHLYSYDSSQNATFPAKVTANGGFSGNLTGNVTGNVSGTAGGVAWANVSGKPTATGSSATGITASTTATKTTLGTAFTIPNITGVGSASTWAFEEISIPNVTSVGSASTWSFSDITVPIRADSDTTIPTAASSATACDDITAWSAGSGSYTQGSFSGGSGSFSATVTNHVLSFSHTHTAATHGTDSHTHTAPSLSYTARSITGVSGSTTVRGVKTGTSSTTTASKASGGNGSAPTLGTAIKVQSKKSGANSTVPTLGTAFSVPNVTGNTSATVSITDPKHTHTIS